MPNIIFNDKIVGTFSLNEGDNKIFIIANIIYHRLDILANAIKHETNIRGTMIGSISQSMFLGTLLFWNVKLSQTVSSL